MCGLFESRALNNIETIYNGFHHIWGLLYIYGHYKVARLDFLGGYLPSLSINYVGMSKDMEKGYHNCIIQRWKFLMIWVLLQSESPWQRNDAFTLFTYLGVSLYQEVFWRNHLREYAPAIIASIMAKFEEILSERFRNILKCSF